MLLLNYLCNLYYNDTYIRNNNWRDDFVFSTIFLLLFKNPFYNKYILNILRNILRNDEENCYAEFKKFKSMYDKNTFVDVIIKYSETYNDNKKMKLINKYFPSAKIIISDYKRYIDIDTIKYNIIKKNKNNPQNTTSRRNDIPEYNSFSKLYLNDDDSICIIENKQGDNCNIYLLYDDIKIQFIATNGYNMYYHSINEIKNIQEIYVNDSKVIKYSELECPFKYLIPKCGPYFIYKINNIYNITYISSSTDYPDLILGKNKLKKNIITIKINPNNLLFLEKMDDKKLEEFINLCENYGVTKYNNIYINNCINPPINNISYFNDKTFNLYKIDKSKLFSSLLDDNNLTVDKFNILYEMRKKKNILSYPTKQKYIVSYDTKENNIVSKITETDIKSDEIKTRLLISLNKLNNKIKKCTINHKYISKFKESLNEIIKLSSKVTKKFSEKFEDPTFDLNKLFAPELFPDVYNYLSSLRLSNICVDLLNNIDMSDDFICSKIKIISEKMSVKTRDYKYVFEAVFELLFGYEITEEQYSRYTDIINNYEESSYRIKNKKYNSTETNIIPYKMQKGGTKNNYPLHHFMMGKGKSAVITPLLTLYFTLIKNKNVYIIVPPHLIKQTKKTMFEYLNFFNVLDKVFIVSDSEIKLKFLNGEFNNIEQNKNTIMLIDEFDSILDPLKSNFNITKKKTENVTNLYKLLKYIITKLNENIDLKDIEISDEFKFSKDIIEYIKLDLSGIIKQLENLELKENINWGIHPTKCYAIPYLNKDNPLIGSNFSSCVLTIFLTLHYYINIQKYKFDNKLTNYIINNNIVHYVFEINYKITDNDNLFFNNLIETNLSKREIYFNKIFEHIINDIHLANYQYNTSFVDIINIDHIFKIGYSGTLNIELPPLDNCFKEITVDYDEQINIKYAILNSNIELFNGINSYESNFEVLLNSFITYDNLKKYSALIDVCGLFKNVENNKVAEKLYNILKRDIIFLDSADNKKVYSDNNIIEYVESVIYNNPFLYYSQSHIVGIDIDQDRYPNILGLCIIDNKTLYTTVAQAVFRLRKLNMGHSVNFYIINKPDKVFTQEDIYKMLEINDIRNKENKHPSLIYQTIKSIIRKNNKSDKPFEDKYKEKIKYYFNTKRETDVQKLLSEIISYPEAQELPIFNHINNITILTKLIYNIDNLSHNIEQEKTQEQESDQESNQELQIKFNMNFHIMYTILPDFKYYIVLKNNIFDNIEEDEEFNNLTLKLNDDIYCLPNISVDDYPYYDKINNNTTKLFFVYLNKKKVLLIVPEYMLMYIYNKFLIFDFKMNIINKEFSYIKERNLPIINKIMENDFIKLCSLKNEDISFEKLNIILKFIFWAYCKHIHNITDIQLKYVNQLAELGLFKIDTSITPEISTEIAKLSDITKLYKYKLPRRSINLKGGNKKKIYNDKKKIYADKIKKYINKMYLK